MEDKAVKECTEIVFRNRFVLQRIGKTLHDAIALAVNDFVGVHSLFKSCYESHDDALREEVTSSGLAEDLQYIDILKQKVEHVMALHAQVEEADNFKLLSGAIFKLNYLQIKVADLDFSLTVGRIRAKLIMLRGQMTSALGHFDKNDYMRHAADVSEALERACKMLDEIAAQYTAFPWDDLRLKAVSSWYSIESERFVLGWLMQKQGGATHQQLLADYKNMVKSMSVELF